MVSSNSICVIHLSYYYCYLDNYNMRYFQPDLNKLGQWRILITENGTHVDMCGALDEWTAYETCTLLNEVERVRGKAVEGGR